MNGISMDELKDFLKTNREIEFTYRNEEYTIEPGGCDKNVLFSVYRCKPGTTIGDCICKYCTSLGVSSDDAVIEGFLNTKCYDGKSFMEIQKEVTVDVIY